LQQPVAARLPAPQVDDELTARAEHERHDFARVANRAAAQALKRHHQHLLHEVGRRMRIAQMPQAVQAHPPRQPPAQGGFRIAVDAGTRSGDAARQHRIVLFGRIGCRIVPSTLHGGSISHASYGEEV
jgi:hypothetical protein